MTTSSKPEFVTDDERWLAVTSRDPRAEDAFVYSVQTTGVYCRPTCASRLALRKNVRFYASSTDAETAGFRACLRCKPNAAPLAKEHVDAVTRACELIASSKKLPTLAALARAANLSEFHFHRIFKTHTGLTPRAYARAHRAITTPQKSTRTTETIHWATGRCSLGLAFVAATDAGVCAIMLGDEPAALVTDLQRRFPKAKLVQADREFDATVTKVVALADRPQSKIDFALDLRGTAFQIRVWQKLREIPCGETATYSELARRIGHPRATRAVARACAENKIAIIIPCHRVIGRDGSLTGYRWGVARKAKLLEAERRPK